MKNKKPLSFLLSTFLGLVIITSAAILFRTTMRNDKEIIGERIIRSYMKANAIKIRPLTKEYKIFMRQIFWGTYPELGEIGTEYIETQEELEGVMDYAWKYSGYERLYGRQNEPEVREAPTPPAE